MSGRVVIRAVMMTMVMGSKVEAHLSVLFFFQLVLFFGKAIREIMLLAAGRRSLLLECER